MLLGIIFRRKALGIEMSLARRVAFMGEHRPSIRSRLEALRLLRQQIARKAVSGFRADETQDLRYRDLQNRRTERRALESELAREVSDINPLKLSAINLHSVASVLPADSALVEFVKFRRYDFASLPSPAKNMWQEYRYAAFVLLAPEAVRLVDLGDAGAIDRLINQYRSSIDQAAKGQDRGLVTDEAHSEDRSASPGIALRAAVFDPLKTSLGSTSRLILAPDGELTRLAFETLPLDDGKRYLIDNYRMSYVDTGRELLRSRVAPNPPSSSPVVVADPHWVSGACGLLPSL